LERLELKSIRVSPALLEFVTRLLLVPAIMLLLQVVATIGLRMTFPLALDWLEGSQIYHGYRLLHGLDLYRVDTSGFLPHPYPPAHPAVLAAVGAVFGLDYLTARAVSVAAWAAAALLLAGQVWRHWPDRQLRVAMAVVTLGYFAATYRMTEGWVDAARVDSLALFFAVLAAVPLAGQRLSWPGLLLSALVASLAIYTKQTTVFLAVGLCVIVARRDLKKGIALAATMGIICVVALVALEVVTEGGFLPWLLNTRHHKIHPDQFFYGPLKVITWAPFLLLLPLILGRWRRGARLSPRAALWAGLLLAAVPASILPLAKKGGALNSLLPLWFLAGPAVLLLLGDLARRADEKTRRRITAAVMIFQAVYFPFFFFKPSKAVPVEPERQRAAALNEAVASLEGGVICPLYPFVPVRNGHDMAQASWLAHNDAMWADMPGVTADSYRAWLLGSRPRWILLTDPSVEQEQKVREMIRGRYVLDRQLSAPSWDGRWQSNPLPRMLYRRVEDR